MSTAEDVFINDLMPIIKSYLTQKSTHVLDKQIDQIESQLHQLRLDSTCNPIENEPLNHGSASSTSFSRGVEVDSDKLVIDLTLRDLQDDVQDFIAASFGYDTIDDLLADRPELDGVVTTLEL